MRALQRTKFEEANCIRVVVKQGIELFRKTNAGTYENLTKNKF